MELIEQGLNLTSALRYKEVHRNDFVESSPEPDCLSARRSAVRFQLLQIFSQRFIIRITSLPEEFVNPAIQEVVYG